MIYLIVAIALVLLAIAYIGFAWLIGIMLMGSTRPHKETHVEVITDEEKDQWRRTMGRK